MRSYELMMIHRSDLAEEDVRSRVVAVEDRIGGVGTLDGTDFWGKRRFAYEIDHMTEGWYSVIEFTGENALVSELDRTLSLSDEVVRHKILRRGEAGS